MTESTLRTAHREEAHFAILEVEGVLDGATVGSFLRACRAAATANHSPIVLDLRQLRRIDETGAGALLDLGPCVEAIIADQGSAVLNMLITSGVDRQAHVVTSTHLLTGTSDR